MPSQIHPTAIVDAHAKIGEGSSIGPYCIIGPNVEVGTDCVLQSHVVLEGPIQIGNNARIHSHAVLGGPPQHTGYKGEATVVTIGQDCVIREGVTIHRGTVGGGGHTRVGNKVYLMAYSHVAHDCIVGNNVILANAVQLAGHVIVEDFSTVGGHSAIAQHCRVGRYCYVGGGSVLRQDLTPFMSGKGADFKVQGVNAVGLSRLGFSSETIRAVKNIYKIFYRKGLTLAQAEDKILQDVGSIDEAKVFLDFIRSSKAGFIR